MKGIAAAVLAKGQTGDQPLVRKAVYAWYPARFGTWETGGIWVLDGANDAPAMWKLLGAAFAPPKAKTEDA